MKPDRVCMALLALALSAPALAYDGVYAFGDSLSDNGNIYAYTGGAFPPAPYWQGRFSNGPVMVEDLAKGLGVPLHDYAYGGATSGTGNNLNGSYGLGGLPGLSWEISTYGSGNLDPNGLYAVWAGANDALALFSSLSPSSTMTQVLASAANTIGTSTTNVTDAVSTLESRGARHILVLNLPDLGLTPRAISENAVYPGFTTLAANYSLSFNQTLSGKLGTLQATPGFDAGIIQFNVFGALTQVLNDAAAYGFTDTTQGCLDTGTSSVCSDPGSYAFWDDVHPTARLHQVLANEVLAAVPEPAEWALLLAGLGMVTVLAKRRERVAGESGCGEDHCVSSRFSARQLVKVKKNVMKFVSESMIRLLFAATIALLGGCATLSDAVSAKGTGLAHTYAEPQKVVWKALPPIITGLGLSLVDENPEKGFILAQRGITAFSYGEDVAIFIEPLNVNETRVEVVSKRALATNVFAPNWEVDILKKLDQTLKPATPALPH